MKCRNEKLKEEPTEELPNCCDAEDMRTTFRNLNCEIVYASELTHILDLDSAIARTIFAGIITTQNCAFVETIPLSNLLSSYEFTFTYRA